MSLFSSKSRFGTALPAIVLLLAATGACKPDPSSTTATSATPKSSSTAAASAAQAPSPYADSDLKVAEDFAAEAEKNITADNYKDKLAEVAQALEPEQADAGAADAGPTDAGPTKAGGPALRTP